MRNSTLLLVLLAGLAIGFLLGRKYPTAAAIQRALDEMDAAEVAALVTSLERRWGVSATQPRASVLRASSERPVDAGTDAGAISESAACVPGDACPPARPAEMMRWYRRVLDARDLKAFTALVHPEKGVERKRLWNHGNSWEQLTSHYDAEAITLGVLNAISEATFIYTDLEGLECPNEYGHDGIAECSVTTGVYGTFRWMKDGEKIFLLSIDENTD